MKIISVEKIDYSILTPISSNGTPSVLLHVSPNKDKKGRGNYKTEQPLKIETTDSSLKMFMKTLNTIQNEIDQLLNIQ